MCDDETILAHRRGMLASSVLHQRPKFEKKQSIILPLSTIPPVVKHNTAYWDARGTLDPLTGQGSRRTHKSTQHDQ